MLLVYCKREHPVNLHLQVMTVHTTSHCASKEQALKPHIPHALVRAAMRRSIKISMLHMLMHERCQAVEGLWAVSRSACAITLANCKLGPQSRMPDLPLQALARHPRINMRCHHCQPPVGMTVTLQPPLAKHIAMQLVSQIWRLQQHHQCSIQLM